MTIEAIMAVMLTMCVMVGVYFTILWWKIDSIESDVNEIKRKMEAEQRQEKKQNKYCKE